MSNNKDNQPTHQQIMDQLHEARMNLWMDINTSVGANCAPLLFASIEGYVVARIQQYHHETQKPDEKKDEPRN